MGRRTKASGGEGRRTKMASESDDGSAVCFVERGGGGAVGSEGGPSEVCVGRSLLEECWVRQVPWYVREDFALGGVLHAMLGSAGSAGFVARYREKREMALRGGDGVRFASGFEVDPRMRVVARTKADAMEEFAELGKRRGLVRGEREMPYMFQTAPAGTFRGARFHAYRFPEDALVAMARIKERGGFRDPSTGEECEVAQVYELQGGGASRFAYLMFDLEVCASWLEGCSGDVVGAYHEIMRSFPLWMYERMLEKGFVSSDQVVTCVVKDKSRALPEKGDFKHSLHVVFEVLGCPTVHHRAACASILRPYQGDLERLARSKDMSFLSTEQLRCPVWGLDARTLHGNQGFATLFSKKRARDPDAVLVCRHFFSQGEMTATKEFGTIASGYVRTLGCAVWHLYEASYTMPKLFSTVYAQDAYTRLQGRLEKGPCCGRDVSADAASASAGVRKRRRTWEVEDAFFKGREAYGALLRKAKEGLGFVGEARNLTEAYPFLDRMRSQVQSCGEVMFPASCSHAVMMVRAEGLPCPVRLSGEDRLYVHGSNGIVLALGLDCSGEVGKGYVYAHCLDCDARREARANHLGFFRWWPREEEARVPFTPRGHEEDVIVASTPGMDGVGGDLE